MDRQSLLEQENKPGFFRSLPTAVKLILVLGLCAAPLFWAALCSRRANSGVQPAPIEYSRCAANYDASANCSSYSSQDRPAQNVILLIGDGMGYNQIRAARTYLNGPDQPLVLEQLPYRGSVTTCSADDVTDSAAAATAMSTGHKTINGSVAVQAMPVYRRLDTMLERIHSHKAVGVVSTAAIWDATPAAFVAHAPLRDQSRRIACEMINDSRPEIIMGGGAAAFQELLPCPGGGLMVDLMRQAGELGYRQFRNRSDLLAATADPSPKALGLFASDDMSYQIEHENHVDEPTLSEMAAYALRALERDPRGFFLMIEGGRIDHACHETSLIKMVAEVQEFDRTVALALEWAADRGDTLVLVTADHETGGMEILPGSYTQGELVKVKWTRQVFPHYAQHSSQLVPIFGTGPGAEMIRPRMDNTEISCIVTQALGIGGK